MHLQCCLFHSPFHTGLISSSTETIPNHSCHTSQYLSKLYCGLWAGAMKGTLGFKFQVYCGCTQQEIRFLFSSLLLWIKSVTCLPAGSFLHFKQPFQLSWSYSTKSMMFSWAQDCKSCCSPGLCRNTPPKTYFTGNTIRFHFTWLYSLIWILLQKVLGWSLPHCSNN